jgi:hypothetical protein
MDIAEPTLINRRQLGCFSFCFWFVVAFSVCVFVFVCFENKVPSLAYLDTKDGIFCELLSSIYEKNDQKIFVAPN